MVLEGKRLAALMEEFIKPSFSTLISFLSRGNEGSVSAQKLLTNMVYIN